MPSYQTPTEAQSRLSGRYGVSATLLQGHVDDASLEADARGPWLGEKYARAQVLFFPRSETLPGDMAGQVPEAVKNFVALYACKLSRADEPGVAAKSVQHLGSKTYSRPALSEVDRLLKGAERDLARYRSTGAATLSVAGSLSGYRRPFPAGNVNDPYA